MKEGGLIIFRGLISVRLVFVLNFMEEEGLGQNTKNEGAERMFDVSAEQR